MSDPVTVKLSRPVTAIDRTFTEMSFREPTGADIAQCGYPTIFGADESTRIDTRAVNKLIGKLGNVPEATASALPIGDWTACMRAVMSFFGNGATKSSTDISSAPPSGLAV